MEKQTKFQKRPYKEQSLINIPKNLPTLKQVIGLMKIASKKASQKTYKSDLDETLCLVATLINSGIKQFCKIYQKVKEQEKNPLVQFKHMKQIAQYKNKDKKAAQYQILRHGLMVFGLVSLGVIKLEKDKIFGQRQRLQAMEWLASFNAERILYGQTSEVQYFGPLLRQDHFFDSYQIVSNLLSENNQELVFQRYQQLKKHSPNKMGPIIYCLTLLKNMVKLSSSQRKLYQRLFLEQIQNFKKNSKKDCSIRNDKKSKQYYLYKAKIKKQLEFHSANCLDELSKYDLIQDQAEPEQKALYNQLKQNLLARLPKQGKKEEVIEFYEKFGMTEKLIEYLSVNLKDFGLTDSELNQIKSFAGYICNENKQAQQQHNKGKGKQHKQQSIDQHDKQQKRQESQKSQEQNKNQQEKFKSKPIYQSEEDNNNEKKVLSIEGGGIKGLFALMILVEMEYRTGKKIYDIFNFFTGTSIGGIFCLCFASRKYSAKQLLIRMIGKAKNQIFHKILFGKYKICKAIKILAKGYVYNESNIEGLFKQLIGQQEQQADLLNQDPRWADFLITSVIKQNDKYQPCFFYKFTRGFTIQAGLKRVQVNENQEFNFIDIPNFQMTKIWRVMRATSAASPLLPKILINNRQFLDGGFIFNNPTLLAIKFLQAQNINKNLIKCLSILLNNENICLNSNFNLGLTINEFRQRLKLFQSRQIIFRTNEKLQLFKFSSLIGLYSTQEASRILESRLFVIKPLLQQSLDLLLHVELDSVDFKSIKNLEKTADNTLNILDLQNKFNKYCLQLSKQTLPNQPQRPMRRINTRYSIFKQCYQQIDRIFQNRNFDEEDLARALSRFRFPQITQMQQRRIQLSARSQNYPILRIFSRQQPLAYALAIGHYRSIKFFLEQRNRPRDINSIRFSNNWNVYHLCIANDQLISFHTVITYFLLNQFEEQHISQLINLYIMDICSKLSLKECITELNKLFRESRGAISLLQTNQKNSIQFIVYFSAGNIKRYLKQLNKYFQRWIGTILNEVQRNQWRINYE